MVPILSRVRLGLAASGGKGKKSLVHHEFKGFSGKNQQKRRKGNEI